MTTLTGILSSLTGILRREFVSMPRLSPGKKPHSHSHSHSHSAVFLLAFSTSVSSKSKDVIIDEFWKSFYEHYGFIESTRSSKKNMYHNEVFQILHKNKHNQLSEAELEKLEERIEYLTCSYDDVKNIYQHTPELCRKIILEDKPCARDYLLSNKLSEVERRYVSYFDHYTIEALMIYSLSSLFNSFKNEMPAVRASTIIDHLNKLVKQQAIFLLEIKEKDKDVKWIKLELENGNKGNVYQIGALLLNFLVDRDLLSYTNDLSTDNESHTIHRKKDKHYSHKKLFVICNFDMDLLPMKLNLPMVSKPLKWESLKAQPLSLYDLRGGYRNQSLSRHKLFTSRNIDHFYVQLKSNFYELLAVMNKLQDQSFRINSEMLRFIKENHNLLVREGLLMPSSLGTSNTSNALQSLRSFYLEDLNIQNVCKYQELASELMIRVQRSRFENFVIQLASAYEGYDIYLPAFLDFRGRIYRTGVLHFHERDISRSLIVFSKPEEEYHLRCEAEKEEIMRIIYASIAFHYQKFSNYDSASKWYEKQKIHLLEASSLIKFSLKASSPFQFISKVICTNSDDSDIDLLQLPITQDASASAYQICSYLLLDKTIARNTNLIRDPNSNNIADLYVYILEDLRSYLSQCQCFDEALTNIVIKRLTRKLVKQLFMPIVYGKTVISMTNDIYLHYKTLLTKKECWVLASYSDKYFKTHFSSICNLMNLISGISWICSASNNPVCYDIPYLYTVQDYMKTEPYNVWVYDRANKKRRQVTLRVTINERDRRKTQSSTFANFIHQKDANLAMFMIKNIMIYNSSNSRTIPVYTVHDNFITTANNVKCIPYLYNDVFIRGTTTMTFINKFILNNLYSRVREEELMRLKSMYAENESNPVPIKDSYLMSILEIQIPSSTSNKDRKVWNKKIDEIRLNYANYISDISRGEGYEQNLEAFKKELNVDMSIDHFSVHL